MELIHADTYEDAQCEIQRRKASAGGATLMYKIVRSRYKGFDVVAIEPELYTDMLEGELVDGLPPSPLLGNLRSSGWGT